MSPTIIGVLGKAGAGKSTFAQHLISDHGATEVGFADPLRAMAAAINPIVGDGRDQHGNVIREVTRYNDAVDIWGYDAAKALFPELRRFLQVLGTEAGRGVLGENVWVETAMRTVRSLPGLVVLADVRFPNEAEAVLSEGGILVRVIRPGLASIGTHSSETALDSFPVAKTVSNDSTVGALARDADFAAQLAAAVDRTSTTGRVSHP